MILVHVDQIVAIKWLMMLLLLKLLLLLADWLDLTSHHSIWLACGLQLEARIGSVRVGRVLRLHM